MNADENRIALIRYWWEKSEAGLRAAKREFEAEAFSFAVNRLYYAAFYAVSAALFDRRLFFKKHSGVRAAFHREFVKPGFIDVKWGKFYDRLFEDRQEGDYVAFIKFEKDYVNEQLRESKEFLKMVKPLISSI